MTLKDLGLPSVAELEAMNDEALLAYFARFLPLTRPKPENLKVELVKAKKPKAAKAAKPKSELEEAKDEVMKMAAELGRELKL
jgi:hypothetical protein